VDGVRADEDDRNATDGEADGTGNVVQLWPHAHGTDAMFLALIRRD
jgi:16S rRNA (cytosine967-C5)-methyltransferase